MDDIVKRIRQQSYFGTEPYEAANEIEQLRQRVQELEKDCDEYHQVAMNHIHANEKLTAERDKVNQYWQIAEGRCDALMKQRDELVAALEEVILWDQLDTVKTMAAQKPWPDIVRKCQQAIASVKERSCC